VVKWKFLTTFTLWIIEAKNLPANDSNGLSDPFVVIPNKQPGIVNLPKKGFKTHKIKKTLNPKWNENFILNCNLEKNSDIKIEVYDDNLLTKNVLLGECILNVEWLCATKIRHHEEWIGLYKMKKNKSTGQMERVMKGELHIKIVLPPGHLVNPNSNIKTDYNLQPGYWIPIMEDKVNVGLGWDFTKNDIFDLDASVTAFDYEIKPIESIYFRRLIGLNGSVKHHGDNLTGEGDGDDEVVVIDLKNVPEHVKLLAVTVNSYKGNSLIKAKSGFIRLFTRKAKLGKYVLSRSKDCVGLLLGLFERDNYNDQWFFQVMLDPIEGRVVTDSYDSITKLLINYDKNFTEAISNYKSLHPLPNEIVFQPNSWIPINSQKTYVGLGWDIQKGIVYDLDSSVIAFYNDNKIVDTIYYKKLKSLDGHIQHHGDNKNGFGSGDDEIISIDFPQLDKNIQSMAVILNSFKGNLLSDIRGGFIDYLQIKDQLDVTY